MNQYDLSPNSGGFNNNRNNKRRGPRLPDSQTLSGTFWRGIISGVFAIVALGALGLGAALIGYAYFSQGLPTMAELENRKSSFQSLRILDRSGQPINESFSPDAGRRTEVGLDQIANELTLATIATEDANYLRHPGVDVVALGRAVYYAFQARGFVSGASTIPQQLAKMLFLSPEQTFSRKIKEAILSVEMELRLTKDEILELYLNEVYYGNLAYGIGAASRTYFGKEPNELNLAESSLLAGLPQLPAVYDPYTALEKAKRRQSVVLSLMVEEGYISAAEADAAYSEELSFIPPRYDLQHPHFVLYVRQQLESLIDSEDLYTLGLDVTTTLDVQLQQEAERAVAEHVASLSSRNAFNGALVSIDPRNGDVVAFVGSANFNEVEIDGQVNMALSPRQPGSSIKPLVYLSTFENPNVPVDERWTPGTLIPDIEEDFPDGINEPYRPTNYDEREHGLVTVRDSLAGSYNIPAVRAIQEVGIPTFLGLTQRLGITTLTRPDYGLSLSLGSGEIPLIEMTSAYSTIANRGRLVTPTTIRKIVYSDGTVFCDADAGIPCTPLAANTGQQVVTEIDAFLVADMMSDNEARTPVFGPNSALVLRAPDGSIRPAAAKTGTTNDIRDVWTMGFTPELVTGVWVGNTDNSPMTDLTGAAGAAPIWNRFMTAALANVPPSGFAPPAGVRQWETCSDTGAVPSEACPRKRNLWFAEDRPPQPKEKDLYQLIRLDKLTGKLATEFTPADAIEEKVFKVYPDPYREWAIENNIAQPPRDESEVFTFEPEVIIRQPLEGESVSGTIAVIGTANTPAFASYELQYGVSHDPGAFSAPFAGSNAPLIDGVLGQWDVSGLGEGPHTLRLVVRDSVGNGFERRIRLFVTKPTATPPPSPTWTPPPTHTPTQAAIDVVPTDTPDVIEKPTVAAEVDTPIPVQRATDTPVPEQPTQPPQPTDSGVPVVEEPTPIPVEPTPVPEQPTPIPVEPTPVPVEPTPVPAEPTPIPVEPTPVPVEPTPVPPEPTPIPVEPTPLPVEPTPAPAEPTPVPEVPTADPLAPTPTWTPAP